MKVNYIDPSSGKLRNGEVLHLFTRTTEEVQIPGKWTKTLVPTTYALVKCLTKSEEGRYPYNNPNGVEVKPHFIEVRMLDCTPLEDDKA